MRRIHADVRTVPGRIHGHPREGREVRGNHEPELRRPHGPCGVRSVSRLAGGRRRQRIGRTYRRTSGLATVIRSLRSFKVIKVGKVVKDIGVIKDIKDFKDIKLKRFGILRTQLKDSV